jgi:ADP-ribose pyrophosphatase YjhB (NUDIX family)
MIDKKVSPTEPRWLLYGLARCRHWRRRVLPLRVTSTIASVTSGSVALAAEIMAKHTGLEVQHIDMLFTQQTGYATPKVDVREAVFREGRILLVREISDESRWTLPGGWADVNESPAECVVKEVREEAGLEVHPYKLAAVWDRARHAHRPTYPFHIWKLFFLCEVTHGEPRSGLETSEAAFFEENAPAVWRPPVDLVKLPENMLEARQSG